MRSKRVKAGDRARGGARMLRTTLSAAAAAVALTIGLSAGGPGGEAARAQATSPSKLSGKYAFEVKWSIFPELVLAQGKASLAELGERYEMRLDASAKLAVPAINWNGSFAVRGEGALGEGRPLRFERRSRRPELETAVVVKWGGQGEPPTTDTYVRPAGYVIKRDPVDPTQITDVVDPLSFMAAILRKVESTDGASCDITMNTWDGARLARIEIATHETVQAARTDCKVIYRDIDGLRADSPWRAEEASTTRILRFVRKGLRWEPQFLKIDGTFLGYDSTFMTTITPLDR